MTDQARVLSVTQISQYLKGKMDTDPLLSGLLVRGEVSNYKMYPSGHHYFTLKDAESSLRCVLFKSDAARLRFRPENGMQVIAAGRVTVFPRDGQYQLYCVRLIPEGAGDLHLAFEQLKKRLGEEGLFAPEHKKPLPRFPDTIALVTSPAGAAVRDMIRILGRRWPAAQVLVVPVRVQGEGAAEEIAAAINYVNYYRLSQLIITGRGGGSMEDLWAFNEEPVARAIYSSRIPVISAVGHEPDVTISDYVADLRAATPSHAAEGAVPDREELRAALEQLRRRLEQGTLRPLGEYRRRLESLKKSRALTDPGELLRERRVLLDHQGQLLAHGLERTVSRQRQRFARACTALDALSPLKVLGRGYAIARNEQGQVVRRVEQVELGESLELNIENGSLRCTVMGRQRDTREES